MPIYEYTCKECNTLFEELLQKTPEKSPACPQCSSGNTEKKMSAGSISMGSKSAPACASTCAGPETCCSGGSCPMH